jgi:zinc D-Ala-D-Ala dipeptidase
MMLLSDPRISAVPVVDNADPLVDLRQTPGLRVDHRLADRAGRFALLRREVRDRLLAAQRALPDDLRLLVVEGFRPPEQQQQIIDDYRAELRRRQPDWSPERLHTETSKFVSPLDVAPHATGGAVDLTLCRPDGVELDLGTPIDATPLASDNACFTGARNIQVPAWHARHILVGVLRGAGLVNYPTEWWHWSFGDRYWAARTGAPHARYGPVTGVIPWR